MTDNSGGSVINTFAEVFCKACNTVFTRSLASDWKFEGVEEPGAEEGEKLFCLEVAQSGGNIKMAVALRHEDASKIIEKILGEPVPLDEEINEDQGQIVQSVLEESCTAALSDARWGLGRDFAASVTTPAWDAVVSFALSGTDGESGAIVLRIQLSPELLSAITSAVEKSAAAAAASAPAPKAAAKPEPKPQHDARDAGSDENLGLVMDVELDLTLCFGRRQMTLKDILHLGPGSVVELDREVQEPVDLLLGDKIVARGEVVIVDGNYGLRVTELVS